MIPIDPLLLVRAASVYLAVMPTAVVWVCRKPDQRAWGGALLAAMWNLPVLLAVNLIAERAGLWHFDARGGLLLGMPVDLWLAWAWLWGAVPALAGPSIPLAAIVAIALAVDLVAMPAAAPVLRLGPGWLFGEAAGLLIALVPGQLLARWTMREVHLPWRALLQIGAFTGLILFLLPSVIITGSGSAWQNPFLRPAWQISLIIQLLALPALLGLTAVQEFVTRGGGTPVPFDPPRRLVMSGAYAYVRNPMQLSAVVLMALLGLVLWNPWVAAAGVMAHVYSSGLAGWDEDADLRDRFGGAWTAYRRGVRAWMPRWRPWTPDGQPPARLFVAASCGMCSDVGRWFARRDARALVIVAAEAHPSRTLTRITYESADGTYAASGIQAIGRALEHISLGWLPVGTILRIPLLSPVIQLLVDASGGEPRAAMGPARQSE